MTVKDFLEVFSVERKVIVCTEDIKDTYLHFDYNLCEWVDDYDEVYDGANVEVFGISPVDIMTTKIYVY